MADTIDISLVTNTGVKAVYPFYQQYPLMDLVYKKGKNPMILHVDVTADSITGSLAELAKPTNIVHNYAVPEQVYIRSDNAGDTGKRIYVVGEKADGSFGLFTLTSDGSNGTTPVDVGTWNFIGFVINFDTWAGNVIIDDDGASTTVYWTCALGATATTGILVVPTGYKGAILALSSWLTAAPSNVNCNDRFKIGTDYGWSLNSYRQNYDGSPAKYTHIEDAEAQIKVQAIYTGAAETDAEIEFYVVLWED